MKYSVAAVNVTPNYPVFQDGFGGRVTRSTGCHSEQYIKTLCLEQNGEKFLFFACDTCVIKTEYVLNTKEKLSHLYGIMPQNILINYTHTHSGPALHEWLRHGVDNQYVVFFFEKLMEAAAMVIECSHEGVLFYGQNETYIGVNRRLKTSNNQVTMMPNIDGEIDRTLCVVTIRDLSGKVMVILCSCACHPVIVSDYLLSSDYPGVACLELESAYPGATSMFLQGCCGDVNPILQNGFEGAVMIGKVFAHDVRTVIDHLSYQIEPKFMSQVTSFDLPIDEYEVDAFIKMVNSEDTHFAKYGQNMLDQINTNTAPHEISFSISCITISSNVKIFALEGEIVSAYANWIRHKYPDIGLLVLGYSNGYCGYIPTKKILEEGGYEADVAFEWVGLPGRLNQNVEDIVKRNILSLCTEDKSVVFE